MKLIEKDKIMDGQKTGRHKIVPIFHKATEILNKYKISEDNRDIVMELEHIRQKNNLPENPFIYERKLLNYKHLPTAKKTLATLIACYKKPCLLHNMPGSQGAKQVTMLNRRGFVFGSNKKNELVLRKGKEEFRKIIGFDESRVIQDCHLVECSKENKKIFMKGKSDPLTGQKLSLNIEHRTPTDRLERNHKVSPKLTNEMVENGTAIEIFQVVSDSTNYKKREVCKKCLNGKGEYKIEIPLREQKMAKKCGIKHKEYQFFDAIDCSGCFYHDLDGYYGLD